ncbi:MAG: methyltransferase domain-containing protein, partial [Verrucomicrobia bacterium]|nr:methyltransferase domain-containing protein [Verrucomicrobiota bacterium]
MRVVRNFDRVYSEQEDPWNIGNADSSRYNFYHDKILQYAKDRSSILDIGCGFGSFLARFKDHFHRLIGVELSRIAIAKGKQKHPDIDFFQGSADHLEAIPHLPPQASAILSSDVIYYLDDKGKRAHLDWIADHLRPQGLAFIAAWTPGGDYLTHEELKEWVLRRFTIDEEHLLDSGHTVFLCRPRQLYVAITVDYETWHPIPEGKVIDWDVDIFQPCERMMQLGNRLHIPFTFMVEMGEYFWLKQSLPHVAEKMETQWQEAIRYGHDVQLHLHTNWLPELGARCTQGNWDWDWSKRKAADYPGDLTELIKTCKQALESLLQKVAPDYRATSFRAGAYQTRPFSRLYDALVANDILCDTSVFLYGVSQERDYDYSLAHSNHQPYWASR